MSNIGILGAGTWGIALARMLANSGHKVTVWSAIESEIVRNLILCIVIVLRLELLDGWLI